MPYNNIVPPIVCAKREKGSSMEDKTFDEVMEEITMGLKRDPEHDITYLKEQMESFKDHPLAKEIGRACSRLMWEVLPDEEKQELDKIIDNHESSSRYQRGHVQHKDRKHGESARDHRTPRTEV